MMDRTQRFDAILLRQGVTPIACGNTSTAALTELEVRRIDAEMAVRAQRGILASQREALRVCETDRPHQSPFWREQIAETELRLAAARRALAEIGE